MNVDETILCCAWRDEKARKLCFLTSTDSTAISVPVPGKRGKPPKEKPLMVTDYNMNMNGCDMADQAVAYFGVQERKQKKWWKKIFYWMIELAQFNALVITLWLILTIVDFPSATSKDGF